VARALFDEGRRFMAAGNVEEACGKFAASLRLDAKCGTLLNLAVCHEAQGKTATAWVEFKEGAIWARMDRRPDREKLAEERIAALEPKLSRLTVTLALGADVPGLELHLDGTEVDRAMLGTAVPIDPGDHVVRARAAGKKTREVRVSVGAANDAKLVLVAPLERDDSPSASVRPAPLLPRASAQVPVRSPSEDRGVARTTDRRLVGYAVGTGGLVAVGVGAYFGLSAKRRYDEASSEHCVAGSCDDTAVVLSRDAYRMAWISTVWTGVGLGAVGVGAYLIATGAGTGTAASRKVAVAPEIGPGVAAVTVRGTWR
jgi:hypothetical protein